MKVLYVTERTPFGMGEWKHHDTYIIAQHVISVRPSPEGCVILCRDGVAFDTANDPHAIVEALQDA